MVDEDPKPRAGQRLGAQESSGISTLEPGHRPPSGPAGRHLSLKVRMLDDTEETFDVSQRAPGKVLFDLVCTHLNLIEGGYFGLEFLDRRKLALVTRLSSLTGCKTENVDQDGPSQMPLS